MSKNIKTVDFYENINPLFQRGDNQVFDKLIRFIQENEKDKNLDGKLEIELDKIELEGFIFSQTKRDKKEILTQEEKIKIKEEIIETYFTEKKRYERYYKPFSKNIEEFEKTVEVFIQIPEGELNVEEITISLLKSLSKMRNTINEVAKGRDRFSFKKDSMEIISRTKKIHQTMTKNQIKLNEENSLEGILTNISKEVLENYNKEIEDISFMSLREQISHIAEEIKLNAVSFDNIKKGMFDNSDRTKELKEKNDITKIVELPSLRGVTNPGSDFEYRINNQFSNLLIEGKEKKKNQQREIKSRKEKETFVRELNENEIFKKDLREIILSILKVSEIKTNASTQNLFLNENEIKYGDFSLDKDLVKSFLNITLSTEEDNLKVLQVIGNLNNIEGSNVLSIINNKPQENLKKLHKELKKEENSEKQKERVGQEIESIRKVQEEFVNFKEVHGEYITSFIEEEFVNLLNYSIYVYKENEKIEKYVKEGKNLKEHYSYKKSEILFKDENEINDFVELLLFLKENKEILRSKAKGLSYKDIEVIEEIISNFAVKSFKELDKEMLKRVLNKKEEIKTSLINYKNNQQKTEKEISKKIFK